MHRVFRGISKYIIRLSGRVNGMTKLHKDEDYVCSFLGLLGIDIKVEYNICVEACKKRLFRKLVQERGAASVFSHNGVGVFQTLYSR